MDEQPTTTPETMTAAVAEQPASPKRNTNFLKRYSIVAGIVLVMGLGLVFLLEKDGRLQTGIFAFVLDTSREAVALVNGVAITRGDYESSVAQLLQVAVQQGADTTNPETVQQYETQAIETLINAQLLRQAALEAGHEATKEAIEGRLSQIRTDVGGEEALSARLQEFGISEASLLRDIENEIVIQALFNERIPLDDISTVTEEEVETLYTQIGGESAGLPPLVEVTEQVKEQILLNRQQAEIATYLEELRGQATIEMLL